ncbi:MAG: aminotransferase class I/II-fold pyridoxal phosphate-dependent enzyme [Mogibacterium sp.]|nr:aminotransferase class I/II-fold pyridoxal phosphate-dependent enzyme [Mogibacterium sp.]
MRYDFDQIIDRSDTNALKKEGWREYIFKDPEGKKTFRFRDEEFIHMWVADMEFRCADEILDAIKARVDHGILGYSTVYSNAYPDAFAAWCERRYGFTFNKEELCYSPGIIPALFQLVGDICGPDGKAVFQTPSYGFFKHASTYNGCGMLFNKMIYSHGTWELDFEDLEAKCADPSAKVLIFCNPQNPTGRAWTADELTRIAEIVEKNDLYIISDEIHCDIRRAGVQHIPMGVIIKDYPKLVTCMSASKCFNMAGLQMSNILIRDPELRATFKAADKLAGFLNPLSIAGMQAAYESGEEWLNEMNQYVDENYRYVKAFLDERFPAVEFQIPDATYLAWVNFGAVLPAGTEVNDFFANNAGVLIEGGDILFVDNAEGFVRLNLAMPRSSIMTAMQRIDDAIRQATEI